MEAKLWDLVAEREIRALLYRYMRGQDRLLPEVHRSVFADDSYVDCGPYKGSADGFVSYAQGFLAHTLGSQHLIGQADIVVSGELASGEVYFIAQHRIVEDGVEKDLFVAGRYIDEYAYRQDAWKIIKRRELVDWARTDPATDSFLRTEAGAGLNLAARGMDDFSTNRNWP